MPDTLTLRGHHVVLEPLQWTHVDALTAAAGSDPSLYPWSAVPIGKAAVTKYVETALAGRDASTAVPFAIRRLADGTIIGSSRFFDLEHWKWPEDHPRHTRREPDVCEIGYTWFTPSAMRTGANTEAKLLMLTHAFEIWQVFRVCLHTDVRNTRSRAAMERIGCRFEGILRAHRLATDLTPRDSARYSIVAADWPAIRQDLQRKLLQRPSGKLTSSTS